MDKPAEIKSIKIRLGDEEADLTVDQARSLLAALEDIFGKPEPRKEKEYVPYPYPQPYPVYPYWPRRWFDTSPRWTMGGTSTSGYFSTGTGTLTLNVGSGGG